MKLITAPTAINKIEIISKDFIVASLRYGCHQNIPCIARALVRICIHMSLLQGNLKLLKQKALYL